VASRSSLPILDSVKRTDQDRTVPQAPDLLQLLRDSGLRVTRQRLAVLDALVALAHAGHQSVISAVRRDLPEVSHQAVYDSLRPLPAAGLARRIQPTGSVARYEARGGHEHQQPVRPD